MSSLEHLLAETGLHMRVHRSYLVQQNAVSEMKPNGEGEAIIFVSSNVQSLLAENIASQLMLC